jgi:dihydrofolate reductase
VPIFVYSRQGPGIDIGNWPLVTYVSDVETAITRAKQAAGDNNVLVHGAATAQLALAVGLLDELEIHLIPVLLGQARRLFDNLSPDQIGGERRRRVIPPPGVRAVPCATARRRSR